MFSRKIFENLHTLVAILVLFGQFLGKFCLNFLPLYLSVALTMMHFVRTFSIMRAWGVRLIVIEKVRNYGNIVGLFIKNMFENGWCAPTCSDNNVSYHYTNQPIWLQYDAGKILSQLF